MHPCADLQTGGSPCLQLKMQEAFAEHWLLVLEVYCMPMDTLHEVNWVMMMKGGRASHHCLHHVRLW